MLKVLHVVLLSLLIPLVLIVKAVLLGVFFIKMYFEPWDN